MTTPYERFLESKAQCGDFSGFEPIWMPSFLFDFQSSIVDWNLRKGKSATFADCGMGKTAIELVWAENVVRKTNRPVLILTPLAVAQQTIREAEKFGIEAHRTSGQVLPGINVTNYEKLHHFCPEDFAGVVCDESSAIKAFNGKRRAEVTEFLRTLSYRLLATATAGRRAIGIELKPSYWRQSIKNLETVEADTDDSDQMTIEDMLKVEPTTDTEDAPQ